MLTHRYFENNKPFDFNPAEFPEVVAELNELKTKISSFQHHESDLVIISFVKDHAIRSDLVKSHAAIVKIITSKGSCAHLENIFSLSKGNTTFRASLESYITHALNTVYTRQSKPLQPAQGVPRNDQK